MARSSKPRQCLPWLTALLAMISIGLALSSPKALADPRPTNPEVGPSTVELLSYQANGYRFLAVPPNDAPPSGFEQPGFDDSQFGSGRAAFGAGEGGDVDGRDCPLRSTVHSAWPLGSQLVVRRVVRIPAGAASVRIMLSVDNDIAGVFFNGTRVTDLVAHGECPIVDEFRLDVPQELVRAGDNLVAFHVLDRAPELGPANETFFDARILAESRLRVSPLSATFGLPGPANRTGTIGDPVNTATGNYVFQHEDLAIPGRGLPFRFVRTHNSLDDYTGPLGRGWTHSYNIFLAERPNGDVVVKQGDGREEMYRTHEGIYLPSSAGVFSTLHKSGDGSFTLTAKHKITYEFDPRGTLRRVHDRNGNTLTFSYDERSNLSSIADTVGRIIKLRYDGANRLMELVDPLGRTVQYTYNNHGALASDTNPLGGIIKYEYDGAGRVAEITGRRGEKLVRNVYDAAGRVASQVNARNFETTFAYDVPHVGATTITDPRGNTSTHIRDAQLRLVASTDPHGNTATLSYDEDNNVTRVSDRAGNVAELTYDDRGNEVTITDPGGNTTAFSYDAADNITTITDARGSRRVFGYDTAGNLARIADALGNVTTWVVDNLGQLIESANPAGAVTRFEYDEHGNVTRITDALGGTRIFSYDAIGRLTGTTDANGRTASGAYDANSRLTQIVDPLKRATRFVYDASGNLVQVVDAKRNATTYGYDEVGNITHVTDALTNVNEFTYDGNNNRIAWINANGNATSYHFNPLNRVSAVTDALGNRIAYGYDAAGNLAEIVDANSRSTTFTYDANSLLSSIRYRDGSVVRYGYDADRNRTLMEDWRGATHYIYDALSRLTQVVHAAGGTVLYDYDSTNNRTRVVYPDGKDLAYGYDALGRLIRVVHSDGQETTYRYDPAGNVLNEQYANGTLTAYQYDAADQLLEVEHQRGNATTIAHFTYTLDELGNRTRVVHDGLLLPRVDLSFAYDALARLVSANRWVAGQPGERFSYTYDPVGNRVSASHSNERIDYQYDAANRLLRAGNTTFSYDANGSRISEARLGAEHTTFSYDGANRLTRIAGPTIDVIYAYDGDGHKVMETLSEDGETNRTVRLLHDVASSYPLILQEEDSARGLSRFEYGLGLISGELGEQTPGFLQRVFYHADGLGSITALTDSGGQVRARYEYDIWGNLTEQIGPVPSRFLFTGEEQDTQTGFVYLRARWYDPTTATFLTKEPLPAMGAVPPLGWASGISLAFGGAGGLALPLGAMTIMPGTEYAYAHNNPMTFVDPLGLWSLKSIGKGIASAAKSKVGNFVVRTALSAGGTWALTAVLTPVLAPVTDGFAPFIAAAAAGFISGAASQLAVSAINGEFGRVSGGMIGGRALLAGTFGIVNGLIPVVGPLLTGTTTLGLSVGEQVYAGWLTRALSSAASSIATEAALRSAREPLFELRSAPLRK